MRGVCRNRSRGLGALRFCVEQLEAKLLLAAVAPDWAEYNDDPQHAYDLGSASQTYGGLTIHNMADEDYFKWTAPAAGVVQADVIPAITRGDLDVFIYDANLNPVTESVGVTSSESAAWSVSAGEQYYIVVQNSAAAKFPGYDLAIQLYPSQYTAGMDMLIYNDSAGRDVHYEFDGGNVYDGTIVLPDSAIQAAPQDESSAIYYVEPYQADLQLDTASATGTMSSFDGGAWFYADGLVDPAPTAWQYAASFNGFTGLDNDPTDHTMDVGMTSMSEDSAVIARATWSQQDQGGTAVNVLSLALIYQGAGGEYYESAPVTFTDLDPAATSLGLLVQSANGQTVEAQYSLDGGDWTSIDSYAVSGETIVGMPDWAPYLWMKAASAGAPDLPTVTVSASDPNAAEQGQDPGQFTISRSGPTDKDLVVNYTVGGTATSADYTPDFGTQGTLTIPAGESAITVDLTPTDDSLVEGDETMVLSLAEDPAYHIGSLNTATITIADNDATAGQIVGTIYADANSNSVQDAGEQGLAGWTVTLDANNDGTPEQTATTDSSGAYSFTNLAAGTYTVAEQAPAGWQAVNPEGGAWSVPLNTGEIYRGVDFANTQQATAQPQNYVVMFAGGGDKANNHVRYYNNIKRLYTVLTTKYGIPADNIFVLASDGNNSAIDQNTDDGKYINSDYSFAKNVQSATWANLQATVMSLVPRMTSQDHFLLWTYDHGAGTSGDASDKTEYVVGWNMEFIQDTQLKGLVDNVHAGYKTFIFGQCYSGGMLDDLAPLGDHSFGMVSTTQQEPSWSGSFIGAATAGLEAGVSTTRALFQYAYAHDNYATDGKGPDAAYIDYDATGDAVEHPWSTGGDYEIFARPNNDAPSLVKMETLSAAASQQDVTITYDDLLAHAKAYDPNGDAVFFLINSVTAGTLTKNGQAVVPGQTTLSDGESLLWHRPQGASGPVAAFTIVASDGVNVSTRVVPVQIDTAAAGLLTAKDDQFSVAGDSASNPLNVLANDKGMGGLYVLRVGSAQHGTASIDTNGHLLYTPNADYFGADVFTYVAADAHGSTASATVTVTVTKVQHAPQASIDHFTLTSAKTAAVNVLSNDFDPDGDKLTITQGTMPAHGTLQIINNTCRYTPAAGFNGLDSFTYTISDGHKHTSTSTAYVQMALPPNQAPAARLSATSITKASTAAYRFTITYTDDGLVNYATIGNGDVTVTGPKGYHQTATLVSAKPAKNAASIAAVYSVPAPKGQWNKAANGVYTVAMNSKQVQDTLKASVAAGTVGTFAVNVATKKKTASRAVFGSTAVLAQGDVARTVVGGNDVLLGKREVKVFSEAAVADA